MYNGRCIVGELQLKTYNRRCIVGELQWKMYNRRCIVGDLKRDNYSWSRRFIVGAGGRCIYCIVRDLMWDNCSEIFIVEDIISSVRLKVGDLRFKVGDL